MTTTALNFRAHRSAAAMSTPCTKPWSLEVSSCAPAGTTGRGSRPQSAASMRSSMFARVWRTVPSMMASTRTMSTTRETYQMNVASDTAIRIIDTVIASCGTNSESASMDRCRVSEYATTPTYTARMPRTARDWMKSRSSWCEKFPDATCSTMSVIEMVVVSTVSVVDEMKLSMSDAADASPGHRNRAHGTSPEMRTSCSTSEATMPTAAVRIGHAHNRADRKCLRLPKNSRMNPILADAPGEPATARRQAGRGSPGRPRSSGRRTTPRARRRR